MDELIQKYVKDIEWIRERLSSMDDMLNPVMGIRDFDDAVAVDFSGRLIASADGPYMKRLVLKSALVHAATDVVVKGANPVFALDCVIGVKDEVEEMIDSLKEQAEYMRIPLIGGNTLYEDVEPRCCLTVFGQLLIDEPIRDRGAVEGDVVALVGEPIWGERRQRLEKARLLFTTWYDALKEVRFNSSKDVTKGGLVSTVYEMEQKSQKKFRLGEVPYTMTRNLDNFLVTLGEKEYPKLELVCEKHGCIIHKIGEVV